MFVLTIKKITKLKKKFEKKIDEKITKHKKTFLDNYVELSILIMII